MKKIIGKFYFYLKCKVQNRGKNVLLPFSSIAYKTEFGSYISIYERVSLSDCKVDSMTYIGNDSKIYNCSIGKFCSIGANVKIGLGRHPSTGFVSTSPVFYSKKGQLPIIFDIEEEKFPEYLRINIGNDVWVGYNVTILDGVSIGDGAIIAAGSVVTKDVLPYSIVGGVPAKLIKYRFSEEIILALINLKWWEKDIVWIKENFELFNDVMVLLNYFNLKNDKA